jgi:ankyrin repeat protein
MAKKQNLDKKNIKLVNTNEVSQLAKALLGLGMSSPKSSKLTPVDAQLLCAVQDGLIGETKDLISKGANVNCCDDLGNTLLHIAIELNFVNIVEVLLKAGADTSIVNYLDKTPLQLANEFFLRYQQILNLFSSKS